MSPTNASLITTSVRRLLSSVTLYFSRLAIVAVVVVA